MTDQEETKVERFRIAPVGIWTGALDYVPTSRSQELGVQLEELGYGAIWVPEVAGRDPFVHLALLLSSTQSVIGATGIANIWGRDAVCMNEAAKALTEAFPERFLLGLGVSHQHLVETLRGHSYQKPLASMAAYLDAMDAAPYTAVRPSTPMRRVIGALRPGMLRLSSQKADGAHPYFVPVEHTAMARGVLGDAPLLCPEQAVLLDEDPTSARETARNFMTVYLAAPNYANVLLHMGFEEDDLADGGSDRLVDAIVAWGSLETIVERVRAHLAAGADHVAVQVITDAGRSVPIDQWRLLAPALSEIQVT